MGTEADFKSCPARTWDHSEALLSLRLNISLFFLGPWEKILPSLTQWVAQNVKKGVQVMWGERRGLRAQRDPFIHSRPRL